jgi:hypothetical protein
MEAFMIRYVLVLGLLLSFCAGVQAQDRLPPIPAEKMTEAQKKAVAEYTAARGPLTGPWNVLLRSPELINRQRGVSDYVRFNSVLSPSLTGHYTTISMVLKTARTALPADATRRRHLRRFAGEVDAYLPG